MNPNRYANRSSCQHALPSACLRYAGCFLLAVASIGVAHADDGDLDPSFSGDGIAFADWASPLRTDQPVAVAIAPDAKVYVGATVLRTGDNRDFAIARFRADGSVDTAFGFQGVRTVGFDLVENGYDTLNGVHPLADGKLMLVGRAEIPDDIVARARPAMVRLTTTGDADPAFGNDGRRVFSASPWPSAGLHMVTSTRQADGKYLFGGYCTSCPDTYRAVVLRVGVNGEPDPGFGTEGWASIAVEGQPRFAAIETDPQGRIVLAGHRLAVTPNVPLLVRFMPNGAADPAFGDGTGAIEVDALPPSDADGWAATALAIERDSSLLVAVREVADTMLERTGILRLAADGSLDAGYADSGFSELTREDGSRINALALRSDRHLVATGVIDHTGGGSDVYVARLLANGDPDPAFDGNGVLRIALAEPGADAAISVVLSGSRPLIGAYVYRDDSVDGAALRLESDGIFTGDFD